MTNKQFDLTWDYPALLWFLAELYEQNIFNFKVEKIIQRLTEPLSNESNLPKMQSNRLFLALALTKLHQTHKPRTINNEPQTTVEPSNLQTIINNLLTGINRSSINSELPRNNTTLRYGTSGITWIYRQLHRLTGDNHFKKKMEYWINTLFVSGNSIDFSGLNFENLKAFGLLEGLGGTLFNTVTSEKNG